MILDDIKAKLQEIDPHVYYGAVDPTNEFSLWNYTIFSRDRMNTNDNKTSHTYYYTVAIIRENFIPEGLAEQVIEKMCEIPGMRFAPSDHPFDYMVKPSTSAIIELLRLTFYKPKKVC